MDSMNGCCSIIRLNVQKNASTERAGILKQNLY